MIDAVDLASALPPAIEMTAPAIVPWESLTDAQKIYKVPTPPIRFRGNNNAAITFLTPTELYKQCGITFEIGQTLLGCARAFPRQIWMLNPCLSMDQLWAKEFCHELSHVNGWTEKHEE